MCSNFKQLLQQQQAPRARLYVVYIFGLAFASPAGGEGGGDGGGKESAPPTQAEARSPETAFHSTSTLHTNTIPNVLILGSFEILGSTDDRAGSISSPNLPPMKQFQGSGICLITSRKLQEVWEALWVGRCIVHKGRGEGVGLPLRVSLTLQSHFSNSRAF